MASNTWVAKLNYMRKLEGVHKWEKRWVSKGSIMVFKWVRTSTRCKHKSDEQGEEGEVGDIDHASLAAAFGEEEEVGRRRLTRGKAADMGIDVPQISNNNDALLAGRSAPGTGVGVAAGDTGSRKRARDDAVAGEADGEKKVKEEEGRSGGKE